MSKNTMRNIWKDKQKQEDRLNKIHQKKNNAEKTETQGENSTDASAETDK